MHNRHCEKQKTVIGILAHVDAGKTTLSESILYKTGVIRKSGRVDDGDTAFDTDELERKRGITIFSSSAGFSFSGREFVLLDTPGHVDFSAETERTLQILDACVLVISGTEGVQAHTKTLWRLLSFYEIPVFIFVTKMDYARRSEEELLQELSETLSENCVSFQNGLSEEAYELLATGSEEALSEYLSEGELSDATIGDLIEARKAYPVCFGSGLKGDGVSEFLKILSQYAPVREYPEDFGARVYKITYDENDNRLVHLKVTGGSLQVKDVIREEKVNQIRVYTGQKYVPVSELQAGDVAAVTGLTNVAGGDGLGYEDMENRPVLEPVMNYSIQLPDGVDPMAVLPKLRKLSEEDPMLRIRWNDHTKQIEVGLMGEVQAEILKSVILDRFSLPVEIGKGTVLYKETILQEVEGVGHYEPLRHYAEAHILLTPLSRGSGIQYAADCPLDELDRNWQRLILQNLSEKEHLGVLTGSPLTDVRLTVISGRAHLKHTEGGDFRQATYRAVRQGLMCTESVLLEPWYRFRLEAPESAISRAILDIREMGGTFLAPAYAGAHSVLSGRAPVICLSDYAKKVSAYTGGTGHLQLTADGYDLCHNADEVIASFRYVPEADLANTPDSVFCAHGAGFTVPWSSVPNYMHVPMRDSKKEEFQVLTGPVHRKIDADDETLEELMLREFGPIRRPVYGTARKTVTAPKKAETKETLLGDDLKRVRPDLLIVDGYNVIFAWEELKKLAEEDIAAARGRLAHIVSNYSGFIRCETYLVFDGYRVPGNPGEAYDLSNIKVVYTKERETADLYIQKLLQEFPKGANIRVITSDGIIQLTALKQGVLRQSSQEFEREVLSAEKTITELLSKKRSGQKTRIGDVIKLPDTE